MWPFSTIKNLKKQLAEANKTIVALQFDIKNEKNTSAAVLKAFESYKKVVAPLIQPVE